MSDPVKRLHGIYRGVVQDNKDPQSHRRIRVSIPQTTGNEITDWVWPVEPSSVHLDVPSIGQGVWVSYSGGDPEYPVWHGVFGTHQGASKPIKIKPLSNSTSLTGITSYIVVNTLPDGTQEVDLVASLLAMANKLVNLESRVHTLETTPDVDPR